MHVHLIEPSRIGTFSFWNTIYLDANSAYVSQVIDRGRSNPNSQGKHEQWLHNLAGPIPGQSALIQLIHGQPESLLRIDPHGVDPKQPIVLQDQIDGPVR